MHQILDVLEFRSNNEVHRPVISALELLKKYAGSGQHYYSPDERVPIEGVIKSGWRDVVVELEDGQEKSTVNYEISVSRHHRERLRCKEIKWSALIAIGTRRFTC